MRNLVGRVFALADGQYRIVDVHRLGADALVYAERQQRVGDADLGGSRAPARTAFRYGDIVGLLDAAPPM
jgi:hypothetical protein